MYSYYCLVLLRLLLTTYCVVYLVYYTLVYSIYANLLISIISPIPYPMHVNTPEVLSNSKPMHYNYIEGPVVKGACEYSVSIPGECEYWNAG